MDAMGLVGSTEAGLRFVDVLDVAADAIGGKADLLVCEIVDDLLLGESVQTTVGDGNDHTEAPTPARRASPCLSYGTPP